MNSISYSKSIPIIGNHDVVIAGSGPAGICAAVAAAREGVDVALIERYGVVGGNLSVGHVGPILGMVSKGTMRDEVVSLLGVDKNDMIGEIGVAHDMERAKRVLADFVNMENITVYLQNTVSDVIMDGDTVKGLIISGKEGLSAVMGKIVIDCTGDADVAFLSGVPTEKGREDGLMQPVTLEFTLTGIDEDKAIVCIGDVDEVQFNGKRFLDYCKECAENGELPPALAAVRLHRTSTPGERQVNTTQLNRIDSTKTEDLFKAEVELRNQIKIITDFCKSHLPGYENCKVSSSGTTMGVRESRRIVGEYVMKVEDVAEGRRFQDAIVHKAEFIVDIHNPNGAGQAEAKIQYSKPYDIPYRAFVPLVVQGLLVAGRCISGTHKAHASYRVMSICMAMGQAVGIASALCVKKNILPRVLDAKEIQDVLMQKGVDLFSI